LRKSDLKQKKNKKKRGVRSIERQNGVNKINLKTHFATIERKNKERETKRKERKKMNKQIQQPHI